MVDNFEFLLRLSFPDFPSALPLSTFSVQKLRVFRSEFIVSKQQLVTKKKKKWSTHLLWLHMFISGDSVSYTFRKKNSRNFQAMKGVTAEYSRRNSLNWMKFPVNSYNSAVDFGQRLAKITFLRQKNCLSLPFIGHWLSIPLPSSVFIVSTSNIPLTHRVLLQQTYKFIQSNIDQFVIGGGGGGDGSVADMFLDRFVPTTTK